MCPPSLKAPIEAEPLPPAGIDPAALEAAFPGLSAFLFGDWAPWARDKVRRLDQGAKWCAALESKGAPTP